MTARRRLLAVASTAAALAALTACEKPAPLVTVVSNGQSEYREANVFCFDESKTLPDDSCAERSEGVTTIEVTGGQTVGIDVGKELVERGWQIVLSDPQDPERAQRSEVFEDDHYFTFTAPNLPPDGVAQLTVQTVDESGAPTGRWDFALVRAD